MERMGLSSRKSSLWMLLFLSLLQGLHSFQSPVGIRQPLILKPIQALRTLPCLQLSPVPSTPAVAAAASTPLQLAFKAGIVAAALQWILAKLVFCNQKCPSILQETAEYTAHSVVALGLMILLSGLGVMGWWLDPFDIVGPERLLGVSALGQWMAAVVFGSFALWDIPTSIRVKALRKPDVIAHHCVMMLLAAMGSTLLPMPYIVYYFGVVELSSIPLIFYDQTAHWMDTLSSNHSNNTATTTETTETTQLQSRLEKVQPIFGMIAALAFTCIRVVSFTKVTLKNFLPDCLQALSVLSLPLPQEWTIRFLMVACGGFTLLQWYWFSQMVTAFRKGQV